MATDRLTKATKALVRAAKTVQPEQGERARRNARTRVLNALRVLRRVLDADYPRAAKPRKQHRRKGLPKWGQRDRVSDPVSLERLSKAGIKIDHIRNMGVLAPVWAIELADGKCTIAQLVGARRNIKLRKKLLTLVRLPSVKP